MAWPATGHGRAQRWSGPDAAATVCLPSSIRVGFLERLNSGWGMEDGSKTAGGRFRQKAQPSLPWKKGSGATMEPEGEPTKPPNLPRGKAQCATEQPRRRGIAGACMPVSAEGSGAAAKTTIVSVRRVQGHRP